MDASYYEMLVREAIAALPAHLKNALKDVTIVIEDHQPPNHSGILLGLYEGVPLPAWAAGLLRQAPR